jgi:hypothetical protein
MSTKKKNFCKSIDNFTGDISYMMHLDQDVSRKNTIGGCCSFFTNLVILAIVAVLTKGLILNENPYISKINVVD